MNRIIILPLLLLFNFSNAQFLMFPGDTNNDGIANYYDILPIGLAYNAIGEPRPIPNIDWLPQEFFPWGQNLPFSNVEYAFIDCDGNGFIDSLDVEAIAHNYEMMQNEANPPPMPYDLPDTLLTTNIPELNISFSVDTAFVTDTFFAEIELVFPQPVENPALGIALGLEYDADLVKDSLTVIFPDTIADDMMFVSAASNFVGFYRDLPQGRVEMGAAGRGQSVIAGNRVLGKVRFITEDVIIRSIEKEFVINFTDVLLINNQERVLEVGTHSDTIVLVDPINKVDELDLSDKIQIFPNPANNLLNIKTDNLEIQNVLIINQLGQVVFSLKVPNPSQVQIDVESLPCGIYFTKIQTNQGFLTKKICFF